MATRNSSSSMVANGGLTPTAPLQPSVPGSSGNATVAGYCADTIVLVKKDARYDVLYVSGSFGANGSSWGQANQLYFSRLAIIAGEIPDAGQQLNVGIGAPSPKLEDYSGRIILDQDITVSPTGNFSGFQFRFHEDTDEGRVGVDRGEISVWLAALRDANNNIVPNVMGKLFLQYRSKYDSTVARNYPIPQQLKRS